MQSAEGFTRSLGGHWFGHYGQAPCPKCQPEKRPEQHALSIRTGNNGRLLLWCFKTGCSFESITAAACLDSNGFATNTVGTLVRPETNRQAEAEKRARQARALWDCAEPILGTVAETYLRGRGITCDLPDTLRFHPEAWHSPTAKRLPALVARVEGSANFAVHRTYLREDGTGKAPVERPKAMLGGSSGGAVQLSFASGRLVVAEGIETAMSLCCGFLDSPAAVWAALSTSGMRALVLPQRPEHLTVACDGDPAGRAAAVTLAERAHGLGWLVKIIDPGDERDFNDILSRKVTSNER